MKGGLFMTSNRFFQFKATMNQPLVSCGPRRMMICQEGVLAAVAP